MNDILVILILAILGGFALYSCLRKKNRGCGGNCQDCGAGCGGCGGCSGCSGDDCACNNCHHGHGKKPQD